MRKHFRIQNRILLVLALCHLCLILSGCPFGKSTGSVLGGAGGPGGSSSSKASGSSSGSPGDSGFTNPPPGSPPKFPAEGKIAKVVMGVQGSHACALYEAGGVKCWGQGQSGQVSGASGVYSTPVVVDLGNDRAIDVAAGSNFTCAIVLPGGQGDYNNYKVRCWGDNVLSQLGNGGGGGAPGVSKYVLNKLTMQDLTGVIRIAMTSLSGCGIKDSTIYCWGYNASGQLGDGTLGTQSAAVRVLDSSPGLNPVVGAQQIAGGGDHLCAIVSLNPSQSTTKCWGKSDLGQLGPGTGIGGFSSKALDLKVSGYPILANNLGSKHTCLATLKNAACFGSNNSGELGRNTVSSSGSNQLEFVKTPNNANYSWNALKILSLGDAVSCALDGEQVFCWGGGVTGGTKSPVPLKGAESGVRSLSIARANGCFIQNEKVKCWGDNTYGQLGNGKQEGSFFYTPQEVIGL